MSIRTKEQLTQDFEALADEKHHPEVCRASERIRQHLVAQTEALSAPLETDDLPYCYCPGDCEMNVKTDEVCPVVSRIWKDLLPVLLKRIGAETK